MIAYFDFNYVFLNTKEVGYLSASIDHIYFTFKIKNSISFLFEYFSAGFFVLLIYKI